MAGVSSNSIFEIVEKMDKGLNITIDPVRIKVWRNGVLVLLFTYNKDRQLICIKNQHSPVGDDTIDRLIKDTGALLVTEESAVKGIIQNDAVRSTNKILRELQYLVGTDEADEIYTSVRLMFKESQRDKGMRKLPFDQRRDAREAIEYFKRFGVLQIHEPCDCGNQSRHQDGGNYHDIIYLKKDGDTVYIKNETTCILTPPEEWRACFDWEHEVVTHSDWAFYMPNHGKYVNMD